MLVNEGRRVEEDADDGTVTKVEEGSDASVGSDIPDVLTKDAPTDKRLINWLNASSGLKVVNGWECDSAGWSSGEYHTRRYWDWR